jgi:signal transduction histidine kinase
MLLTKGISISEDKVMNMEYIHKQVALMFTLLTFVLLNLLGFTDLLMGMSPMIAWVKIGLSLPFLLVYFLIVNYGRFRIAIHFLLFVGHGLIILNFIYNDGSNGPTMNSFFLMLVVYSLLIQGWAKVAWFIGSFLMYFSLFYGESAGYITIQNFYENNEKLFIDHTMTVTWMSLFIFVVLHFFIESYRNQNELLNSIKIRQDNSLEEVKLLNDQKNRLIALLSHDLKNPIGMLHTTLGLVEKNAFEAGELELILDNLKRQSYHLNHVLNNTLNWVMSELNGEEKVLEEISLVHLVEEIQSMMLVQSMAKNQSLELSVFGEDRQIHLPSNEVRIILKNFLDNAIKFSEEEAVINICLEIKDDSVHWKVSNYGKVIEKEDQLKLFNFVVKTSYGTKKEKGTGIGLPLCKRIADKIGFEIKYNSPEDNLNCFTLSMNLT